MKKCSDCNKKYVGQSRRAIGARIKEHIAHFKHNRFENPVLPNTFL